MGCCSERQKYSIEDKIVLYEDALGFKLIKVSELSRLSDKFSKDQKISKPQFEIMCSDLKIHPKTITYDFVMLFYDKNSNNFDTQILTTLGILLATGREEEKCKLIFQNYDKNNERVLSIREVRKIISDLILIGIDKICEYTGGKIGESDTLLLAEYRAEVMKARGLMISVYTKNVMGENLKIGMDQFVEKMCDHDISVLLNAHKMRVAGRHMARNYLGLAERINLMLDSSIQIDGNLAKEVSKKASGYYFRTNRKHIRV